MKYDRDKHHRKSIRLQGYDYSQNGVDFVTLCVQNRECLFGDIKSDVMESNAAGEMVSKIWTELPVSYPGVFLDEFVVMPNHFHGIVLIDHQHESEGAGAPARPSAGLSFVDVVQRFKSYTTHLYGEGVKRNEFPPFLKHLWQRNFYERIVRDDVELERTRQYIHDNPLRWKEDEENPLRFDDYEKSKKD